MLFVYPKEVLINKINIFLFFLLLILIDQSSKILVSKIMLENELNWVGLGPFGLKMGRIDIESSQEAF